MTAYARRMGQTSQAWSAVYKPSSSILHPLRSMALSTPDAMKGTLTGGVWRFLEWLLGSQGFSAADLPDVEVTANKTGRASLARASAAHFFALRQEVSKQCPTVEAALLCHCFVLSAH